MKRFINKIISHKLLVISSSALALAGVVIPRVTHAASVFDQMSAVISKLILNIAQFLGEILIFVSTFLVRVSSYSDFENADFVIRGWTAVRDLSNMFFIVVLLAIAIATILRIEQYSFKRLLFKLLLMSLLINFSKSIVGFIIEASQVVMLFFFDAYKNGIEGVLLKDLLHLDKLLDITIDSGVATVDFTDVLGVVIGAVIMLIVSIVTVGTIVIVLLFRIVALWILIIFSPLVFLLHAVPSGAAYASRWWGMFTKYVITGPILAFFLWLSLSATTGGDNITTNLLNDSDTGLGGSISAFFESDTLFSFLVGISLLIGALWATSQMGVMGGNIATKAIGQLQTRGAAAGKGIIRVAGTTSRITPLARRVGFAAKKGIERVPLAKLVTQTGRQQAALKQQGSWLTQKLGGTQARADLASKRAKFLKAKEKEMDERGLLADVGIMKTQLKSSSDPIEKEVLVSKILSKDVPDAADLVEKHFGVSDIRKEYTDDKGNIDEKKLKKLKKNKGVQQKMNIYNNLENKIKEKTYASYTKQDKDGDFVFKSQIEHQADQKKKQSGLSREEYKKETHNMRKKGIDSKSGVRKITDVEGDAEKLIMIEATDARVQHDNENNTNIRDAIIDTITRLHGQNADKKYDNVIEALANQHEKVRSQFRGPGERGENLQKRLDAVKIKDISVSTPQNIQAMSQTKTFIGDGITGLKNLRANGSTDKQIINDVMMQLRNSTQHMYTQVKDEGFDTGPLEEQVKDIRRLTKEMRLAMSMGEHTPDSAMKNFVTAVDNFYGQIEKQGIE